MVEARQDYLALAAKSRAAAGAELLENVRAKHITAAAAWELLALQAGQIEIARQQRLLGSTEPA